MTWLSLLAGTVLGAGVAAFVVHRLATQRARERLEQARAEAERIRRAAELDAEAVTHAAEAEAREEGLELLDQAEAELTDRAEKLARREERAAKRAAQLDAEHKTLRQALNAVRDKQREIQSVRDQAKGIFAEADALRDQFRQELERRAGVTGEELKAHLVEQWIEDTRAEAAQRLRQIDQNAQDPEYTRQAKRLMGISVQRYYGHYLTERLLSNLPIPAGFADTLTANDNAFLDAIQEVSGVKLELSESGEKIRIDSGDGVAREIARRALTKLIKGNAPDVAHSDPRKWLSQIAENLNREIDALGRKAFNELEIPKAHPEIVTLVGRLNYRTSYTQNQWKHAIEAAFLAGMMAEELHLDVKLARRATLMHDIGKSLTHVIDGSHAVIGADYARRLGEEEIVANAIGAHHAEEPPNSIYAYLVAASDAMSGARPGARREQSESYANRVDDLERIGERFKGVESAFAVQGGREVRVYVKDEVDDLRAVELSGEIAQKISEELVFPGQIKVTVIRNFEAVHTAS